MIQLYNDDALQILSKIQNNSIDLIVTDPPYDVSTKSIGGTLQTRMKVDKSLKDLENLEITEGYDIEKYAIEFMRIMNEPNIYIWCNKKQIPIYFDLYIKKYSCLFDILCWHKINALPNFSNKYLTDTEYLLYFHSGKGKCFPKSYDDAKTFYLASINYEDKKKYQHPTIKPLDLTEKIIRNSSNENDLVLDCFMGSGTTGVACKRLKRNFIGVEINKEYFNIASKRIENADKVKRLF